MKKLSYQLGLKKGFTLIELLIVITIIGILAVALLPTVLAAPARARDGARTAHINTIAQALEGYNLDEGSYPAGQYCLNETAFASHKAYFPGAQIPNDPLGENAKEFTFAGCAKGQYAYGNIVGVPGQNYWIAAFVERPESANSTVGNVNAAMAGGAPALLDPDDCSTDPCAYVVIK